MRTDKPNLTPQQEAIASHRDGALLVLAGAGSGKTATLIERVGRLIEYGMDPRKIMLTTFSVKAADEISNRLEARFGHDGSEVEVSNFHRWGLNFLRKYQDLFGLPEGASWGVLDDSDQKRMLAELGKAACQQQNQEYKKFRGHLLEKFGYWSLLKQSAVQPRSRQKALEALAKMEAHQTGKKPQAATLWDQMAAQILIDYENEKYEAAYLDFDDMLLKPAQALYKYPEIAKGLAREHMDIMVDEAQDTNRVQYAMIKAVAQHHGRLTFVGDDDQTIYGWRGARPQNIRDFIKDFNAPIKRLEQNFRSHPGIVDAAGRLITHNKSRLPKNPFSKNTKGAAPILATHYEDREMSAAIVERIQSLQSEGVPLGDIAILYRTNRMTQLLEPAIKQAGIPYTVVGGMSFYERQEIKAARAVATLGQKPMDFVQLRNLQPYMDGVGMAGLNQYIEAMEENELTCLDVAMIPGDGALHYGKRGLQIQEFLRQLYVMHLDIVDEDMYPGQAARYMVDWMINGPMKILEREKDDVQRLRREENLERLCHEVKQNAPDDWIAYMIDAPISDYMLTDDKAETLTLSTVHRSKGLEWPHVIVAGFSEGLMPLDRDRMNGKPAKRLEDLPPDDRARALSQQEEERRLIYVALTRGAESVWLGHANEVRFAGSEPMLLNVSPAAKEMGMELTPHNKQVLAIHEEEEPTNRGSGILAAAGLA